MYKETVVRVLFSGLALVMLKFSSIERVYFFSIAVILIPEIFRAIEYDRNQKKEKKEKDEREKKEKDEREKKIIFRYSFAFQVIYLELSYLAEIYEVIDSKIKKSTKDFLTEFSIELKKVNIGYIREVLNDSDIDLNFIDKMNVLLISIEIEYANIETIISNLHSVENKLFEKKVQSRKEALANLVTTIEKRDKEYNYQPTNLEDNIEFLDLLLTNYRKDTSSNKFTMED